MGQGLSKYQAKTGVAMDNYLEENLSKLNFATDSESVQRDIPINKTAIQKSINKMDEIVQDAMTSKKELQELMKTSEKSDTGSLSAYLQSMTTVDSDDEREEDASNQPSTSDEEQQLEESSTTEEDAVQEQEHNENENEKETETETEIPEFVPIHSKSSIYGSSQTILKVHDDDQSTQQEMSPIPVKSVSSIYGTSRKLLEI